MPLKHGEVNPLNVFGLRRTEHCPPHFERVVFNLVAPEKQIEDWVWEHLEGRFWSGQHYYNNNGMCIVSHCVAFEQHGEASYFSLMLDTINKTGYELN